MNFIPSARPENTPYLQLLMLIFYALLGMVIFSVIAILIFLTLYGTDGLKNIQVLLTGPEGLLISRISVVAQQLGLFAFPAVLMAMVERSSLHKFYGFKRPEGSLLGMILLMSIVALPVMEWTMQINQKMILPSFLRDLEVWMKHAEEQAMQATLAFLKMHTVWDYLLNMGMMALLPAVSEELLFRGALQRTFLRLTKRPHLTIWLCAAIFSAIHMQFYGFLPRMLLGAGFGYIYYWTGSLWYVIFAHFLNNGYQISVVWYMQLKGMPVTMDEKGMELPWYGYLASAAMTLILFHFFRSKSREQILSIEQHKEYKNNL